MNATTNQTAADPDTGREERRGSFLDALEASGAEVDRRQDPPRVRSHGDPEAEYASLVEGAALVDDSDRALVRVSGDRATGMLDGMLTRKLSDEVGRAVYSFMLTARGRPVAELRALCVGAGEYWLDMPAACREGALSHMKKYLPPRLARFEAVGDRFRLSMVGPRADEAMAALDTGIQPTGLEPLRAGRGSLAGGDVLAVRREPVEGPGVDLYVTAGSLPTAWEALLSAAERAGGGPAGRDAYDVWRVERGVPVYGADITTDNLPQETGQEDRAVTFDKGCYTGQEVVIRIHHRGHVNRVLRGLSFDTPPQAPPEPGVELLLEERAVGTVTSPVSSPRFGPIALGYVRTKVEPGDVVRAGPDGEREARVSELPFTSA